MGSVSRMARCSRFIKMFDMAFLKKAAFLKGDTLQVDGVHLDRTEGEDTVQLNVIVRNLRTGDQTVLVDSSILFHPEETALDTVDRVASFFHDYEPNTEAQYVKTRKTVIKMLKAANLIDKKYKEGK